MSDHWPNSTTTLSGTKSTRRTPAEALRYNLNDSITATGLVVSNTSNDVLYTLNEGRTSNYYNASSFVTK